MSKITLTTIGIALALLIAVIAQAQSTKKPNATPAKPTPAKMRWSVVVLDWVNSPGENGQEKWTNFAKERDEYLDNGWEPIGGGVYNQTSGGNWTSGFTNVQYVVLRRQFPVTKP